MKLDPSEENTPVRRTLAQLPALRALAVQILSLLLIAALVFVCSRLGSSVIPLFALALAQGGLAALLSRWIGLAPWWLIIQAAFFPLLYVAGMLHLSPLVYLAAFALFLVLYWNTFRTQVPFYPSGPAAWNSVVQLLPRDKPLRIVDIGSGFGGMVFHLAVSRPDCEVLGVELAPLPCYVSKIKALFTHSRGRFLHGDYEQLDFADFDVVFAYLSPAAMPALWSKAQREMRTGSLLLSYEFAVPRVESQFTNSSPRDKRILHGWHM